jgi:hypothetical protein
MLARFRLGHAGIRRFRWCTHHQCKYNKHRDTHRVAPKLVQTLLCESNRTSALADFKAKFRIRFAGPNDFKGRDVTQAANTSLDLRFSLAGWAKARLRRVRLGDGEFNLMRSWSGMMARLHFIVAVTRTGYLR